MNPTYRLSQVVALALLTLASSSPAGFDDPEVVDLGLLEAWRTSKGWEPVRSVGLDPGNPKALAAEPGEGGFYNGSTGRGPNLVSKEEFGDVALHVEFVVPKGSNSGVKFQGVYEVQIYDSFGSTKKPSGRDNGGIYARSEEKPKYHQIDDGQAPSANASRPPGEWQVLDATFLAPRFDASGKKVDCARITVVLNGQLVQDRVEVHSPTGSAWREPEKPTGPILLQGDHGPVAFRNLRARRLSPSP